VRVTADRPTGADPRFAAAARDLGTALARTGIGIVYGRPAASD